jgi:hypothetical protein
VNGANFTAHLFFGGSMILNPAKNKFYLLRHLFFVILFLVSQLFSQTVTAKAMPKRLGVGIKDNTFVSIPSLALIYNMNQDFSITGGLGFDTQKNLSAFQANAGVRHIIFHENNLHFYTGGQLALVNLELPVTGKESGMEFQFVFGTEFFFAGLENVGFSFEGGVALSTYKETRVRTLADHPLKAGLLFYF